MLPFYLLLTTESNNNSAYANTETMNELPVIGSLRLRTDFWDSHGANIVTRYEGTYGERLFGRPKKVILARDYELFIIKIMLLP